MKKLYSIARQEELKKINQVLAYIVVVLALTVGFQLAKNENWLTKKRMVTQIPALTTTSILTNRVNVNISTNSAFIKLLQTARYQRIIDQKSISLTQLKQLLWSAQGEITKWGERTVPSYKSSYPLTLSVWVNQVVGVNAGIYRFDPLNNQLIRQPEAVAPTFPLNQPALINAPVVIGILANQNYLSDPETLSTTYLETGGVMQNLLISAIDLSLVTYAIPPATLLENDYSAFHLPNEIMLALMPFGYEIKEKDSL